MLPIFGLAVRRPEPGGRGGRMSERAGQEWGRGARKVMGVKGVGERGDRGQGGLRVVRFALRPHPRPPDLFGKSRSSKVSVIVADVLREGMIREG